MLSCTISTVVVFSAVCRSFYPGAPSRCTPRCAVLSTSTPAVHKSQESWVLRQWTPLIRKEHFVKTASFEFHKGGVYCSSLVLCNRSFLHKPRFSPIFRFFLHFFILNFRTMKKDIGAVFYRGIINQFSKRLLAIPMGGVGPSVKWFPPPPDHIFPSPKESMERNSYTSQSINTPAMQ